MIAMVANGGPAEAYGLTASTALHREGPLRRLNGPEEIAATNWIVAVPRVPRDRSDGRGWACGSVAETGVLFTLVAKERSAFAFRYAGAATELPDALVPQEELEAFGAMLAGDALKRITLCASKPFSASTAARVAAINADLTTMELPPHSRIELLVIEATVDDLDAD